MVNLLGKAKSVGKNYYFYAALYCIGFLGIMIITIVRYKIIVRELHIVNWDDILTLLGILLALPVLAFSLLQKVTRSLATIIAGIFSIVIMIIYWVSTAGAETFVHNLKDILYPFLPIFLIFSGTKLLIQIWKKIR